MLIGPDGPVGVVPTEEALRMAQNLGLDLVEVSPTARPPVCRILDYGKFKYEQKKKQSRAKTASSVLKEIRVRPKIAAHDLEIRIRQLRHFLEEGHKVQITCIYRGREMVFQQFGRDLLNKMVESVADIGKVERSPQMEGKRLNLLLVKK
ncbi:MAG: translation initiation factor IF-3 [Planctomycetota bacterium]|nr:MAG: translation initiation factor IF-3 [Planctomycetota bacterium]